MKREKSIKSFLCASPVSSLLQGLAKRAMSKEQFDMEYHFARQMVALPLAAWSSQPCLNIMQNDLMIHVCT